MITAQNDIGQLEKIKENVISMIISTELLPGNEKLSKSTSPLGKGKSKRGTREKYKIISDMEYMEKKKNIHIFSHEL